MNLAELERAITRVRLDGIMPDDEIRMYRRAKADVS